MEDKYVVIFPDNSVYGDPESWKGYHQIMSYEKAFSLCRFHNECGIKSKIAKLDFLSQQEQGNEHTS